MSELVARFQLQCRASTVDFAAGVRLARGGAVHIDEANDGYVHAMVEDVRAAHVELLVDSDRLSARCSWSETSDPCPHQVAVAHAVWMRDRQRVD